MPWRLNIVTTINDKPLEMHNPPHPGEVLRELYLEPLGLSVTVTAKKLGVSRKTLSELLNGHTGISPTMALRLSAATATTAESWVNMQAYYDLWQAKKKTKKLKVEMLAA